MSSRCDNARLARYNIRTAIEDAECFHERMAERRFADDADFDKSARDFFRKLYIDLHEAEEALR